MFPGFVRRLDGVSPHRFWRRLDGGHGLTGFGGGSMESRPTGFGVGSPVGWAGWME